MRQPVFLFLAALLLVPSLHAQREKFSMDDVDYIQKTWPNAKKTNTGIRYVIEEEGHGASPKAGAKVDVLYEGSLLHGQFFDKNLDPAHPFHFPIGRRFVIEGWDQVIPMMKEGEKRVVIIPPELAYGYLGHSPNIPRNAALVFKIQLIKVYPENESGDVKSSPGK